jgi:hypothetical protein
MYLPFTLATVNAEPSSERTAVESKKAAFPPGLNVHAYQLWSGSISAKQLARSAVRKRA